MKLYLVSYDLNRPGQDYKSLFEELGKFPVHYHCLKSGWIVKSDQNAYEIASRLLTHIDGSDVLLVNRLTPDTAWYGLLPKGAQWLQDSLT